ncbi:MAG: four-carbon acid sugar kinase family protein [Acidobacteriota bacterium]|nr:four-carbon acid sugar kinase family protein [Acidobacteriota bacterium]
MLYTYYGDDFTGSTDVLEQLGANGIPAVLFVGPPTPAQLAAFPDVEAIGIAGDSRSRSPEWMSANLPGIFRSLQQFDAPITHYKVCSTFDSSPTSGSIGRAIEIGREVFAPPFVPIVVGAPHLRRYVAFGNLFAAAPDGTVQRIDRHPMAHHPVTPMHEADLRLHLAAQTSTKIGLIDDPTLRSGCASATLDALRAAARQAVVFDTIDEQTQSVVGQLLLGCAKKEPLFAVGSSGLTAALVSAWDRLGLIAPIHSSPLSLARPLLVVSGSCSTVTERQLRHALAHGHHGVAINPASLLNPGNTSYAATLEAAAQSLAAGRDTILYTALGTPATPALGDFLGVALGTLLRDLLSRSASAAEPVHRVLVCGGDTASHAVQQLGIHALTWAANIQPGGPLCRAHADSLLDGLELVLKGGQVGTDNFFDLVRGS